MSESNENIKKELIVSLGNVPETIPTYDLFLIRGNADYMEVQLATKTETDTETKVCVEYIFKISREYVPMFAHQFADYLKSLNTQEPKE